LNHLDIFARERVFLLGDSVRLQRMLWIVLISYVQAHAMAPHLGAGAAAGIEVID